MPHPQLQPVAASTGAPPACRASRSARARSPFFPPEPAVPLPPDPPQLRRVDFDALVHSPLQRASLTADIVWAERPGRRLALWELREVDLYGWQGLTRAAAAARDPAAYAAWQHDPEMLQLDGRWPMRELWLRASGVWRALREEFAAGAGGSDPRGCELADGAGPGEEETGTGQDTTRVLLVAHQGVNKALLATALGLPIAAFRCLPQVGWLDRAGGARGARLLGKLGGCQGALSMRLAGVKG